MKSYRLKFVVIFCVQCALVLSLFSSASFTPTVQAAEENALPVGQVLKPDGTLDLSAGYSGNLDFTNFGVSLDPVLGPTFKPLAAVNTWNALGTTPLSTNVYTIVINGSDVYAGGNFQNAGGVAEADFIAKFSGGSWSALGTIPLNNAVHAIAINGSDVYAGGFFSNAGGDANADFIAKFSGGSWSALGATPLNGNVFAVATSGSDVYAGGEFTNAGGVLEADAIAKFSGGVWSAVGGMNLSGTVHAIAISGSDLYAGGLFINAGGVAAADFIAKFSGGIWSALGATPLNSFVYAIAISGSDVYAGGSFINAGGVAAADKIAKFSGGSWSALGATPLNNTVLAITINGLDVYAGGEFIDAGGDVNADFIAKFNGSSWSALGATPLIERVETIAISGSDVYAGGGFINAGGVAEADFIARFVTAPSSPTFGDVPMDHPYWLDIEILYANGFTAGCSTSPLLFCPEDTMNRGQSAVFILRGNFGAAYLPPDPPYTTIFADSWTPGPWAQKWAQGMLAEGLTAGCSVSGPLLYCPWDQTPRLQAAVFGMRLLNGNAYVPPAATGTVFADITDPNLWYAKWAEQAYLSGILPACGTQGGKPLFCPNDIVNRGLGAYMIVRAKNLSMP